MRTGKPPGTNVGKQAGIYQEIGPRGGKHQRFATVAENRTLPPTSHPGSTWRPVKTTPSSKR